MGCSGSKGAGGETLDRPGGSKLTVWGDHFNSDTRTILGILNVAKVSYNLEQVNTLQEEHKKDSYLV